MGLFVTEHGLLQGWLAALLCCWAAVGEDEYEVDKTKTKANVSRPVCNEQPAPTGKMPRKLHTLAAFRDANFSEDDRVRPVSERPPSLKPLDLGEMSLMDRIALHGRRKSSANLLAALTSPKQISIGQPLNFRKLDYTESQRLSLKPLQLEPVVLRGNEGSAEEIVTDKCFPFTEECAIERLSYRGSRDTPWQRCRQNSAIAQDAMSIKEARDGKVDLRENATITNVARAALSTQSSSSSIRSLRRMMLEPTASSSSIINPRASIDRGRLKRKRSNQLSLSESRDLDREILELNTIVEERRMGALRQQSPGHVPAIAPKMSVRARSETLTSIGSAFSRPLRLETSCQTIPESASPMKSPIKSRLSRPFTNMPDTNLAEQDIGVVRRPSSRVTGWLSGLIKDQSTTVTQRDPTRFYACNVPVPRRKVSDSSVTETDSPCLTAASSPVSKAHSRSLTSESRITTLSPPSTACNLEFDARELRNKGADQWRGFESHQVGIAM